LSLFFRHLLLYGTYSLQCHGFKSSFNPSHCDAAEGIYANFYWIPRQRSKPIEIDPNVCMKKGYRREASVIINR